MPEITNRSRTERLYGRVRTPDEVGRLLREERRRQGLTLQDVYEGTSLSTRFLSELERGKDNASLGRTLRALESLGLDVLVLPRAEAEATLRRLGRRPEPDAEGG